MQRLLITRSMWSAFFMPLAQVHDQCEIRDCEYARAQVRQGSCVDFIMNTLLFQVWR